VSDKARTVNMLGALSLGLSDRIRAALEANGGQAAGVPSALIQIWFEPGSSIDHLRRLIGLSHSATVRIVEQLQREGLVEKGKRAADSRSASLKLSKAGEERAIAALAARDQQISRVVASLSESEMKTLGVLLEKIIFETVETEEQSHVFCRLCDISACPQDRCPADPDICP